MGLQRLDAIRVGVGIALSLAATATEAQVVRGVVSDSATGRPVPDATVALIDVRRVPVAAGVTDGAGRFTLGAPAGSYELVLRRIGYRTAPPTPVAIAAGETIRRDVALAAAPLQLTAIRTDTRARCAVNPERGSAAAMLWAEVVKALDATALVQRAGAARLRVRDVERELDPRTLVVRAERRVERSGVSASPYQSPPADTLAAHGYVRDVSGVTWYYAPTAEALVAESFAATHCFQVSFHRPPSPALIGLRFEPVDGRRVPDVRGTIWVDLSSAELRLVDFEYTGLPAWASGRDFGGRVEFGQAAGAGWIVRKWRVQAPREGWIERSEIVATAGGTVYGTRVQTRRELGIVAIREVGGEVLHAAPVAGTRGATGSDSWSVGTGAVRGVVFDSLTGAPLAGAAVEVEGTSLRATAAADGRYTIDGVFAGRQRVTFAHPRATAGERPSVSALDVAADATANADLYLPSAAGSIAALCPAHAASPDTGAVHGIVRATRDGLPVAGATVAMSWSRYDRSGIERLQRIPVVTRVATDSTGAYHVCGVPAGVAVRIRVEGTGDDRPGDRSGGGAPGLEAVIRHPLLMRVDVEAGIPRVVPPGAPTP